MCNHKTVRHAAGQPKIIRGGKENEEEHRFNGTDYQDYDRDRHYFPRICRPEISLGLSRDHTTCNRAYRLVPAVRSFRLFQLQSMQVKEIVQEG
jgi:hypothetical protein